jgi:hypothetical protein
MREQHLCDSPMGKTIAKKPDQGDDGKFKRLIFNIAFVDEACETRKRNQAGNQKCYVSTSLDGR